MDALALSDGGLQGGVGADDLRLRDLDGRVGLGDLRLRCGELGRRRVELAPVEIELLLRDGSPGEERLRAVELLLGEEQLARRSETTASAVARAVCFSLTTATAVSRELRALSICARASRSSARRLSVSMRATTCPASTRSPSSNRMLRNPPGELGRDVDLDGLQAPVADGDAVREQGGLASMPRP